MSFSPLYYSPYVYRGLLAALGVYLAYVLFLTGYRLFISPLRHIPGPWYSSITSLWLVIHSLRLRQCRYVDDLLQKYGPVVRISPNKVVFLDLETMKATYSAAQRLSKSTWYQTLSINGLDYAMTMEDHAPHGMRRKLFSTHYSLASLSAFREPLNTVTADLTKVDFFVFSWIVNDHYFYIQYLKDFDHTGKISHDILSLIQRYMVDISCIHLFGHRSFCINELDMLSTAVQDFPLMANIRYNTPYWLWCILRQIPIRRWQSICNSEADLVSYARRQVKFTRSLLESEVTKISNSEDERTYSHSLVYRLLQHKNPPSQGAPMSEEDIVTETTAHIIAGSDTTSTLVSYILWEIAKDGALQRKLQDEIDQCMTDLERTPSNLVLSNLPLLEAVIHEGLRLYCPAPGLLERVVPSRRDSSFTLMGYGVPPGTIIATQAWSVHREASVFPEPNSFKPMRWSDQDEGSLGRCKETSSALEKQNHMIPFGLGPRICGGQNLATMVTRQLLAALLRNFNIRAADELKEQDMEMKDAFIIFPKSHKCELVFAPRDTPI